MSKRVTKKMKIVWVCRFSNPDIVSRFKIARENKKDRAPWINGLIKMFEEMYDIELHIVAPNMFNNTNYQYCQKNVTYHLYKTTFFLHYRVYNKLQINRKTNFYFLKQRINKIIKQIDPDIVHFHGAENPIYSSAALSVIDLYPTLITIQGFISQDENANSLYALKRKEIEINILKKAYNFGVRTEDMKLYIAKFNNKAKQYWHNYPINKPNVKFIESKIIKEYDFAFFGRVSPENGIKDLLFALFLIKKRKNDVSLVVVGYIGCGYGDELRKYCKSLDIEDNVTFKGFLPTQEEAFNEVVKAKIDVLPTYYDIIPGSIIECMYLGIPVISYSVGGIPELNFERESLILTKKGNVNLLAEKMDFLLNSPSKRVELVHNAKITVEERFNNSVIYDDLIGIYDEIYNENIKRK